MRGNVGAADHASGMLAYAASNTIPIIEASTYQGGVHLSQF